MDAELTTHIAAVCLAAAVPSSEMVRVSYCVLCCALIWAPVKAALEAADGHDDRQLAVCVLFQRSVSLPRLRRRSDPHSQ